jgi:hypothetical protein
VSTPNPVVWRALNVLQRVAGISAAASGTIFTCWAVWFLLYPSMMPDVPQLSPDRRLSQFAVLAFAGVLLSLAAVLLRARPYRPDLGDSLAAGQDLRSSRPAEPQRHWWTGDPLD